MACADRDDLPLPLRWAREDASGHEGAVTIGRITAGEVQAAQLAGEGDFIDAVPELAEALELWRAGLLFPSVDLDDFEFVYTDGDCKSIEVDVRRGVGGVHRVRRGAVHPGDEGPSHGGDHARHTGVHEGTAEPG
ncbi:hypothetical protein [Micromonospora sp. SH-82]|uniref:hypothetical protein n=1 Tax=Micromonospora sp. SH-82 TaxID=3132938 RepID=UPI003EBA0D7D